MNKRFLIITVFLFFHQFAFAQTDGKIKALWVFNFSQYVTWPEEENISKYVIGVLSSNKLVFNELTTIALTNNLKNKPVEIVYFNKLKNLTSVHILYVDFDFNKEIEEIYGKIKGKNTLIVTDRIAEPKFIMINILSLHEGKKRFEVNKQNALEENLVISKELLVHGGTDIDLRDLYTKTERELNEQRAKLEVQREEVKKQEEELIKQKQELSTQKQENANQKNEMTVQEQKIEIQKQQLNGLFGQLESQQEKLNVNLKVLEKQEDKIRIQQNEVDKRDSEIKIKAKEIELQDKKIKSQKNVLTSYNQKFETQQGILTVFLVFLGLILLLVFVVSIGYRNKRKANRLLEEKNIAINHQKEELTTQASQLELLNSELEKLSIVASKTHNAVVIMDPNGNFEWVNTGFTKMYGFTLQLLTHEVDENIVKASTHPEIAKILGKCVKNKETVIYETQNSTRSGEKKWVQTTLTPILDDEEQVVKLVAIDTDISGLKDAEMEIKKQHQQIKEQSVELENKNHELEKLSIVASETDNAVVIMDEVGNFEWVNDAFTRMFGYNYDTLVTKISKNIQGVSESKDNKELIDQCLKTKKTVYFEFLSNTDFGQKIWVQRTLTPILDKSGNIKKLVAIDTDITKVKMAEQEIRQKNEELSSQKDELEIQKGQIELQNKNIKSSILYALTIQKAILPTFQEISSYFESFIIYRPKDIVSGDFYWFSRIPSLNKIFIAAVDCTGHGVPGAFMSMIGNRLLGEIVNEKKIYTPSKILEAVDNEIKQILKQSVSENNDGMDVCLCCISQPDQNNKIAVTYSGAKRPFYYIDALAGDIKSIKGARKSIGGVRAKRNTALFVDVDLMLNKNDMIFLSTDGIIDQNCPERRRFGSERLIEVLHKNYLMPLSKQKEYIEIELENFQKNEPQRDDITLIGIKL